MIIASRNENKCKSQLDEIKNSNLSSTSILDWHALDTSDLDSVRDFVTWFKSKYSYLNFLVNNAGIHYATTEVRGEKNLLFKSAMELKSVQGYDLSFATNYFGHFYLTEALLPMIQWGRVVNVASSYHFQEHGFYTYVHGEGAPLFARADINTFAHRNNAYSSSKLAQILHAKELQRRIHSRGY